MPVYNESFKPAYKIGVQLIATQAAATLMNKTLASSGNSLSWRSDGPHWFVWKNGVQPSLGKALKDAEPMIDFFTTYFGVGPHIWVNFDGVSYRLHDFIIEDRPMS
jgi:hypothetical protein